MRAERLTVRDVMTSDPLTVTEATSLGEVHDEMERGDIRHLPVVDGRGALVGIVTDRDLLRVSARGGWRERRVGGVMTSDVLTVRPESRACEATLLMLDHKVGGLPVIDDAGQLIGVVTETDFLRIAHVMLGGERLSADDK